MARGCCHDFNMADGSKKAVTEVAEVNMEAKSVRGAERVLRKLEDCLNSGNFYEAHQMYRTLHFRYLSQKKYPELLDLLRNGTDKLLEHGQQSSGADLAILFVEVLKKSGVTPDESKLLTLASFFDKMKPDLPERETFLNEALRWSTFGPATNKRGHPTLHRLVAQTFWKEKNYAMARHHYIHSSDGHGCASMLIEFHRFSGYANEIDLFIAQAVLQYLCLRNKSTAKMAFNSYTTQHPNLQTGPPYFLPLLNFIWFLLQAVEGGELVVFTVLCEKYQPSIQRDPSYSDYLVKIGQIFFGVPQQQQQPRNQGLFGLFQSFGTLFNEDSDSEDGAAGAAPRNNSAQRSNRMETEDVD